MLSFDYAKTLFSTAYFFDYSYHIEKRKSKKNQYYKATISFENPITKRQFDLTVNSTRQKNVMLKARELITRTLLSQLSKYGCCYLGDKSGKKSIPIDIGSLMKPSLTLKYDFIQLITRLVKKSELYEDFISLLNNIIPDLSAVRVNLQQLANAFNRQALELYFLDLSHYSSTESIITTTDAHFLPGVFVASSDNLDIVLSTIPEECSDEDFAYGDSSLRSDSDVCSQSKSSSQQLVIKTAVATPGCSSSTQPQKAKEISERFNVENTRYISALTIDECANLLAALSGFFSLKNRLELSRDFDGESLKKLEHACHKVNGFVAELKNKKENLSQQGCYCSLEFKSMLFKPQAPMMKPSRHQLHYQKMRANIELSDSQHKLKSSVKKFQQFVLSHASLNTTQHHLAYALPINENVMLMGMVVKSIKPSLYHNLIKITKSIYTVENEHELNQQLPKVKKAVQALSDELLTLQIKFSKGQQQSKQRDDCEAQIVFYKYCIRYWVCIEKVIQEVSKDISQQHSPRYCLELSPR